MLCVTLNNSFRIEDSSKLGQESNDSMPFFQSDIRPFFQCRNGWRKLNGQNSPRKPRNLATAGNLPPCSDLGYPNPAACGWETKPTRFGGELSGHAAIDGEDLPCNVTGRRAGKEQHASRNVIGMTDTIGRYLFFDFAQNRIAQLGRHLAFDESRRDRVDGH